ncbi:MAG: rRNA cytosine-C5-methyltransferase [Streptosporangiales bacterium]|nr:rRNA cytosine-C5-methyltransferase [Streptosporangiales bacterium]
MSDPARLAAYDTLRAVSSRDAYANLVLPQILARAHLRGRDAALATELAYGTLRHRGTYDAILATLVTRRGGRRQDPLSSLDPPVLDALRLGAHQLLRTRIPPHAAVSETVALARKVLGHGPASLVNAVLRRVARRDHDGWVAEVAPPRDTDPVGHLAVAHAHPEWVVRGFAEALGDGGDVEALLRADNEPADVVVCARPGLCEPAEIPGVPGLLSPYAVTVHGDPGDLAPVREGRAGVQDEGSQLVALALARAEVPPLAGRDREVWLDACAGPGGKAALLGALANGRGAVLVAAERRHRRSRLVQGALAPLPNATAVTADAGAGPWRDASFDRVLVDAPCSGLGSLRRRPEARWRRDPDDVRTLTGVQERLLRAALAAVRPGGVVAYATCSPLLSETSELVARVTGDNRSTAPVDVRSLLTEVGDLGPGPWVQLWPHLHGTDAMFVALLRRTDT